MAPALRPGDGACPRPREREWQYLDFLAPGILAQSVLFAAIFYGIAAIWERDLGVLHRYMVSPAPRSALVLGKAVSSGARGLAQAVVVYILAVAMGVAVDFHALNILGVAAFIALGSGLFSTFSLIIACIVKTRERFMGIGCEARRYAPSLVRFPSRFGSA